MAKKIFDNKLLDCWSPIHSSDDDNTDRIITPLSFITTTFTFDSEFFEEECLTRFLCMETEKENDGVAYLIERESKLAELNGGIVIVDQHNCKGDRSLRWDLVPCRVQNGVMHAKITLLFWSNRIRLIIGSANMTQMGYCINQEVFGVIDYTENCQVDIRILNDVLTFLSGIISKHCGEIIQTRFSRQRDEIKRTLQKWNIQENSIGKDDISVHPIFVYPGNDNILKQIKSFWDKEASSPPYKVYVTSPFFDPAEHPQTPGLKLFEILRQKGDVYINYNVTTELLSETGEKIIVNAPEFLRKKIKENNQFINFFGLSEMGFNEEGMQVPRPVHLKSIWLTNDVFHIYLIGSSNFTSAGYGTLTRSNYEANLLYGVSENRNKNGYKILSKSYLNPISQLDERNVVFRYRTNEDDETTCNEYSNLPDFFGEAILRKNTATYFLELNFNTDIQKKDFKVFTVNLKSQSTSQNLIYSEEIWISEGRKTKALCDLGINPIPDYLEVNWSNSNGNAFWPLIIEDQVTLPPVEPLRDLSLEALIQILSSNQPLHRLLRMIEKLKKGKESSNISETPIDILYLIDSSGFLIQRTRKVSYAMKALRMRLERPVFTLESLKWRLSGPIGLDSMKEAILKEAKSEDEKMFLISELALELSQIQPHTTELSLKSSVVKSAVKNAIIELNKELKTSARRNKSNHIVNYSKRAFNKAINEF